ncbi:MAG: rod shape-determining protein MreC [Proteobacteria bacterium]|nr:rod shape-determining protein MreC [Pseudomonadota bacterium]MBI3496322.1 rod shape-determining protein MreC [Pseudomonadota bacterium]
MQPPVRRSFTRIAEPLRGLAQRFAFLLLVLGTFGLMVVGKADIILIDRLRAAVADGVAPILAFLSEPAARVADVLQTMRELGELRQQNHELKVENERLNQWQFVARRMEAENNALRQLSRLVIDPPAHFITGRVVADGGGVFVRSLLVDAGRRAGAERGQAVLTAEGLVGRVSEVGERAARVILLTDLNSRIPVLIEASRDRAMLTGDNGEHPRLMYLPATARAVPGDRIVTSGDGGAFPPGIPVGVVIDSPDSGIRVQPYVDFTRLEYVRLVDFKLDAPSVTTEVPRGRPKR